MSDLRQQERRDADCTLWLSKEVPLLLNRIPAGSFLMGQRGSGDDREEPVHRVAIANDFYLGIYPVTQKQFAVFAQETGLKHGNHFDNRPDHPAENINWDDVQAFCAWVNALNESGIPKGYVADLPTEAEWEFACRAGTTTEYHKGDGEGALDAVGWFDKNSDGSTHPVGLKASNALGLYDMHGNVDEWCLDGWDSEAYRNRVDGAEDPLHWPEDREEDRPLRVLRGGSWGDGAEWCRSANRYWWGPDFRFGFLGFRLGLFPGPLRAKQKCGVGGAGRKAEGRGARPAMTTEREHLGEGLDHEG